MNSSSTSAATNPNSSLPQEISSHDWPEWPQFLTNLTRLGYYNPSSSSSSTKLIRSELNHDDFRLSPKYFHQAASACLLFAKDHPLLIDSLSKKDIVELVKYGLPSLFKGYKTEERMRAYVRGGDEKSESKGPHFVSEGLSMAQMVCMYVWIHDRLEEKERDESSGRTDLNNASEADRAHTVDLMRYILNEAYMPIFSVDRCGPEPYRNLLRELVHETRVVEDSNDKAS